MEQWHQKMHNNTTPDDIVICKAYVAFLRSDGDPNTFYRSLEAGGVTQRRLESFERPITVEPEFYPDKKDALISDFEHFLKTLKSVHSATDLGTCMQAARHGFDDRMHRLADFIWHHRDAAGEHVTALLRNVTELRGLVITRLESDGILPDLLCLDVAMEDFVRTVVEKNLQSPMVEETRFKGLIQAGDNFLLAHKDQDLSFCMLQWKRIWKPGTPDTDQILQAESVLDRIERTVGDYVQRYQGLLQPKAEFLGKSFHAEPWTIRLFTEEVMRGGLIFALSVLSHHLRRLLRKRARLPSWQPVSRGSGSGRVEATDSLDAIQGRRFDPPAIILSDEMRGDEDLPEGVVAILTSDSVDVVSHIAIRARNQGVLLATCYDEGVFEKLKAGEGRLMAVEIDAAGEVHLEPAEEVEKQDITAGGRHPRSFHMDVAESPDAPYAIAPDRFEKGLVGGKSLHLKELRERLPDWLHVPVSVALPFGTLEKVLGTEANRDVRKHYHGLLKRLDDGDPGALEDLRRTLTNLAQPRDLDSALREVMKNAGLPTPENTERVWGCVKRVWASKWNDRAYWNRRAFGIPHDNLLMAVLIQEMVPAEVAYIIHTVHPFSGDREEVYVEAVLGFGETLAANYPGRALSWSWNKKSGDIRLLGYPSKSIGLYGKGLIFRSDSNAEDLSGYAGAGLYSSFPLDSLKEVHLNYTEEPLIQDKAFRREFLATVGKLGLRVEKAMGSPQDIEGAFAEGRYYVVQTRPQVGLGA